MKKEPTEYRQGTRVQYCAVCSCTAVTETIPVLHTGISPDSGLKDDRILLTEDVTAKEKDALNDAINGKYQSKFKNMSVYMTDVTLYRVSDWTEIHDETVTFTLDYPSGINRFNYSRYTFVVLHLKQDGTTEIVSHKATRDGLQITSSLSAFAVGYRRTATSNGIANTGDASHIHLWISLMAVAAVGLVAAGVYGKKVFGKKGKNKK